MCPLYVGLLDDHGVLQGLPDDRGHDVLRGLAEVQGLLNAAFGLLDDHGVTHDVKGGVHDVHGVLSGLDDAVIVLDGAVLFLGGRDDAVVVLDGVNIFILPVPFDPMSLSSHGVKDHVVVKGLGSSIF